MQSIIIHVSCFTAGMQKHQSHEKAYYSRAVPFHMHGLDLKKSVDNFVSVYHEKYEYSIRTKTWQFNTCHAGGYSLLLGSVWTAR